MRAHRRRFDDASAVSARLEFERFLPKMRRYARNYAKKEKDTRNSRAKYASNMKNEDPSARTRIQVRAIAACNINYARTITLQAI